MSVSIVNPETDPDWDARLATFPDATPFHSAAWARVLAATYRYKPAYLVGTRGLDTEFMAPMMDVRTGFTRPRAVCLPFSDECGPLLRSTDDRTRVLGEFCQLGQQRGWRTIEFRSAPEVAHVGEHAPHFYGHVLALAGSADDLSKEFHPSIRQGLRKAQRCGLHVSFPDTIGGVESFYRLQGMTRRRHGLPPQPFALFRNIHREFILKGAGFIAMVSDGAQALGAVLLLIQGKRATYKFGASLPEAQSARANTLAMAAAIHRCQEMKIGHLDFGRTDPKNSGLRTYKQRWATVEREIYYARYDSQGRTMPARRPGTDGLHNAIFRRLPLPISRLVGTILYRFMG